MSRSGCSRQMLDGVEVRLEERGRARRGGLRRRELRGRPHGALGVPYAVGRESRELYGERWAGRQPATRPGKHNFPVRLSPFAEDGSLLPFVREPELDERGWPADRLGEGDGGLQAYGFRVCLTDRPENRLPLEPPTGYDPGEFELLRRYLPGRAARGERSARSRARPAPEREVRRQLDRPLLAQPARRLATAAIPTATGGARADQRAPPRVHAGLLHFLAHDEGVPERIRVEVARWGSCADEFEDTGGWPHQLYVREGGACSARMSCARRTSSMRCRRRTSSRSARTTSTSARSSGRGATSPSTFASRRSSTRATSPSPSRRTRSPIAR